MWVVIKHEFKTLITHSPEDVSCNILQENDTLRSKHMFKKENQKEENVHSCQLKFRTYNAYFQEGMNVPHLTQTPKQGSSCLATWFVH